ncbi:ABC transporter permease [Parvimonas sp. C2]|uniref:ABC transporter permease n=1 Tax=Parvimonas sp. C2 TaxID=3110692 RepID=UPI002B48A461|nr:ABC transporter permease [Parvimonas sp. C2]MEB3073186.1 ABC transporter permease [Parvimonas sp. C2]
MSKKKEMEKDASLNKQDITPSAFKVIVREFKKDKLATFSFILFVTIILVVFIGSLFFNLEEVMKVNLMNSYLKPGEQGFILGTDQGGRPLLGQLFLGTRNSILIGASVTFLTNLIGIIVGLIIGFYGGIVDNIIMRIIDFIQVLPILMLIIVFVTLVPRYNAFTFVIIMTVFYWVGIARLVRSKALSEGRRDYISASKTMGTPSWKIMFGGILPNISSILIISAILDLAGNMGIEIGLTFLGFGLPDGVPSLGTLINKALDPTVLRDRMYIWFPASMVVLVLMLSINYAGQALRRASDAKQRLG